MDDIVDKINDRLEDIECKSQSKKDVSEFLVVYRITDDRSDTYFRCGILRQELIYCGIEIWFVPSWSV